MNKKGSSLYLAVATGIILFMLGMLIIPFIKDSVTDTRTNLQCSTNSSISDGTKFTCLFVDTAVPYYIIIIISFVGGLIVHEL